MLEEFVYTNSKVSCSWGCLMHFPAHLLGYPLSGTEEVSGDVLLGGQYGNNMDVSVEGHPNMQMGHTVLLWNQRRVHVHEIIPCTVE